MYDFLLMNNSNYGSILHRFGDTAMYMLKITEFVYPCWIYRPTRGGKWYGSNVRMTLHIRFEYSISMSSFVPVHWLVFFCTRVDAEEQVQQEDDDETSRAIPIYTVSQKTVQNCFCQNFVKFTPTLIIFGRKMAKRLELCEVHSFSTSPNSRHHTTTLNRCSKLLHNAVIINTMLTFASSVQ